jgi:hypothetical protein
VDWRWACLQCALIMEHALHSSWQNARCIKAYHSLPIRTQQSARVFMASGYFSHDADGLRMPCDDIPSCFQPQVQGVSGVEGISMLKWVRALDSMPMLQLAVASICVSMHVLRSLLDDVAVYATTVVLATLACKRV